MAPPLLSAHSTAWEVVPLRDLPIQRIWKSSYADFLASGQRLSDVQRKASSDILNCKSGRLGYSVSQCAECGHIEVHNNSCRNRGCPNCQAVKKEIWVDKRRAEVIDSPYFHVVFTLPHELNPLLYANQRLLYGFFHRCCAETLLELSSDKKHLGAVPGIIQVLHTWDQELNYHVHMHCIVSGGGLTPDHKIRTVRKNFLVRVEALRDLFKGKFLAGLQSFFRNGQMHFSASCEKLRSSYQWAEFRDSLYHKDWCPYIKETFNGFGNAMEYLGRYTHKAAISNSRILSVSETQVTFSARGRKQGDPRRKVTLENTEFIRRFLMHVLPKGFQKIRYYGFLNNRMKSKNLRLIFTLQGHRRFRQRYAGLSVPELLKAAWNIDVRVCPACGCSGMRPMGRTYACRY